MGVLYKPEQTLDFISELLFRWCPSNNYQTGHTDSGIVLLGSGWFL